mgnify:CR=1 FL=1
MARKMNLESLCGGGFSEQVNRALIQIAQNIKDPNTDPEKARKLTCTITFKPNEDRSLVTTEIQTKTSLVPADGIKTTMVVGKDIRSGEVEITEYDNQIRGQMAMDDAGRVIDPETGEIQEVPRNIRDLRKVQ